MILISLFFASLIFFMFLAIVIGAPVVPSKPQVAGRMVKLLHLKRGQTVYDLGSGDGRILRIAARQGLQVTGIEINPYLWLISWIMVWVSGVQSRVKIVLGDYWRVNLNQAEGVLVYGIPHIMNRLSKKFKKELKKGTPVVSNSFQIPELRLIREEKVDGTSIYLYRV